MPSLMPATTSSRPSRENFISIGKPRKAVRSAVVASVSGSNSTTRPLVSSPAPTPVGLTVLTIKLVAGATGRGAPVAESYSSVPAEPLTTRRVPSTLDAMEKISKPARAGDFSVAATMPVDVSNSSMTFSQT